MTLDQAELNSKIATWRQKAADGTLSLEEMKEAIQALRGGRVSAAVASEKSKAKKAPARKAPAKKAPARKAPAKKAPAKKAPAKKKAPKRQTR